MKLNQARVLVTGANRGIGLALAEEALHRGAQVWLGARNPNEPDFEAKVNALSKQNGGRARAFALDMSSFEQIEVSRKAIELLNLDLLVNNAGILTGGLLEEQPTKEVYSMFQVNLVGLTHLIQIVLPGMLERKRGLILNNASVSGVMNFPLASTYSAAKTGVVALSRCLQAELKGTGVDCAVSITPGVKTRMFDEIAVKYGKKMDLDFMDQAVTPEAWARQVMDAVESGKTIVEPSGAVKFGLRLSQHVPAAFARLASLKFDRNKQN